MQQTNHLDEWKGEQVSKGGFKRASKMAGKRASKGEGNFYEVNFFILFKKWKIDVFPYNFLMNQDRKLREVAMKRKFQKLSKPLTFFENQ